DYYCQSADNSAYHWVF
nr:immunoglobulin light chain junction region [Macaca mulatta]MOX11252.1 immunoglobulin light chain junction region [Macaca mulatta]MOX12662.1 immunoglobulin light chain junction region [Macaca mulatta]MOX12903.1 immunoglobulin light chain junction region [Macaca mulatta]MOX13564.1 immunoglobulin light chain junction region [Macaca mulatta]